MPEIGEICSAKRLNTHRTARHIWDACPGCGKERWLTLSDKGRYCNSCALLSSYRSGTRRKKFGAEHAQWQGGRRHNRQGYVLVWVSKDDFFASMRDAKSHVLEHRLVMARYLGRCLHRWEIVHHKNGVKDDNQIENLQLVSDDRHKQISILEAKIKKLEQQLALASVLCPYCHKVYVRKVK